MGLLVCSICGQVVKEETEKKITPVVCQACIDKMPLDEVRVIVIHSVPEFALLTKPAHVVAQERREEITRLGFTEEEVLDGDGRETF